METLRVEATTPSIEAMTDIQVAEYLDAFRDRPREEQEASPIWQALSMFPQWMGAQYLDEKHVRISAHERLDDVERPQEVIHQEPLPDPRMPANMVYKPAVVEVKPGVQPAPLPHPQAPQPPRSVTSQTINPSPVNPWADQRPPETEGMVFYAVRTDVPPPWTGMWRR